MPTINVNDAYVLDETGAEVDKVTGLFTKDESTSATEKAQARYNIAAGGSNDNLLDNAYFVGGGSQLGDGIFPINQRGQTSYAGSGYAFDRYIVETYVTATLQATGIRVQTTALYVGITQRVPVNRMEAGKTYTMSVIVDGTLYSTPFVADGSGNWFSALYIDGLDWYAPMRYTSDYWEVKVINSLGNIDHIVSAVKLELGSVSTLANDVPPDFGEELRKCQRYLYVLNAPVYHFLGEVALAGDATNCTISFHLPAEMRTTAPSVTLTSGLWVGGAQTTAVNWTRTLGTTVIAACTVTGGLSGSTLYAVATGASATTITISAEL